MLSIFYCHIQESLFIRYFLLGWKFYFHATCIKVTEKWWYKINFKVKSKNENDHTPFCIHATIVFIFITCTTMLDAFTRISHITFHIWTTERENWNLKNIQKARKKPFIYILLFIIPLSSSMWWVFELSWRLGDLHFLKFSE